MRIVAWNANYNNRRRSLEETFSLIDHLNPDISVISEVASPSLGNPLSALWVGDGAPGLAIIASDGYEVQMLPRGEDLPPLVVACTVKGAITFNLLALWPVQRKGGLTYAQILNDILVRYSGFIKSEMTIMAGDFNSSTRVGSQRRTHPMFVKDASSLGLVSAYHHVTGEPHGSESVATYLHGPKESDRFHIDYCFVPEDVAGTCEVEVLETDEWTELSDHFPVVLDINKASVHERKFGDI